MSAPTYDDAALDIIRRLLELDPGPATAVQLGWEIGGNDVAQRRAARIVLSSLCRSGVLHRFFVRHRDEPFEVIDVQREPLMELLEKNADD